MKVILTERQLELLKTIKFLNEDEMGDNTPNKAELGFDPKMIERFRVQYRQLIPKLNNLYTKINFISIAEILNGEVSIRELVKQIEALDSLNMSITKEVDTYFSKLPKPSNYSEETKFEEINASLDDMYQVNNDKVNIISLILNNLDTMVSELADGDGINFEGVKKVFSDINSINLD